MRSRRLLLMTALILSCLLTWGCNLTLGPVVKTTYVLIQPGKPLVVLEAVKVKARLLDGTVDPVVQDIGGWVCMPQAHFEALKRAAEKATEK